MQVIVMTMVTILMLAIALVVDAVDVEEDNGHICDLALRIMVDTLLITYPPMQDVLASDIAQAQT